jgi:large subunit ribosomal protein L21
MTVYAIVESGGKQYKVSPGQTIAVERLPEEEGSKVELEPVLLVADGDKLAVGKPQVPGAKVIATVLAQGKGGKVIVFKYKPKVRYRKKTGHRQHYTKLRIEEIISGDEDGAQKGRRQHKVRARQHLQKAGG